MHQRQLVKISQQVFTQVDTFTTGTWNSRPTLTVRDSQNQPDKPTLTTGSRRCNPFLNKPVFVIKIHIYFKNETFYFWVLSSRRLFIKYFQDFVSREHYERRSPYIHGYLRSFWALSISVAILNSTGQSGQSLRRTSKLLEQDATVYTNRPLTNIGLLFP